MKEKECVKCKFSTKCPIGNKPLECELPENFTCENLVEMYQIFKIIGGYVKDEKSKEASPFSYFG